MTLDREHLLATTHAAARQFVAENYSSESLLFDTCWEVFAGRFDDLVRSASGSLAIEPMSYVSLTKGSSLDLVTPVVLATVSEALRQLHGKKHSALEAEDLVSKAAAGFGANKELTACLARHLPALCMDAIKIKPGQKAAAVSKAAKVQYQIWTGGESLIVDDLGPYEKRKDSFLFWLDLNEKTHISPTDETCSISKRAVDILRRLVDRLGASIPACQIEDMSLPSNSPIDNLGKNQIEQQLTKLNRFCGGRFREYLFGNWVAEGLGLRQSFADRYFFFLCLRDFPQ